MGEADELAGTEEAAEAQAAGEEGAPQVALTYTGNFVYSAFGPGEHDLHIVCGSSARGTMTICGEAAPVAIEQDGRRVKFIGEKTTILGTICSHGVVRGKVFQRDYAVEGSCTLRPEENLDMPPGSFGAGGWAPGGNGQYPRLTTAQAVAYRRHFRQLLLRRYHSVLRGWKALDRDGNGRLSIYEFLRGCQDLGVDRDKGARNLWDALDIDRSGYISLEEIDLDVAKLLGSLAVTIHVVCGTLDKAWDGWFNKQGYSHRVSKEDFISACEEIGYPGDGAAAWEALRSDLATVGVSRAEFGFLEMWFAQPGPQMRSVLNPKAELEQMARVKDPHDTFKGPTALEVQQTTGKARLQFKKLLIDSYGTYVRAWREGLDRDHNGLLDYSEFKVACTDVGYASSIKVLWKELDANKNGTVSLRELDKATADQIDKIFYLASKRYQTWEGAWEAIFDTCGDDRVKLQAFVTGCRLLGYGGNPDRLFELLDTDRTRYLSLATTRWITGAVLGTEIPEPKPQAEEIGNMMVTGRFRSNTKSRTRLCDKTAREHRLRERKFQDRARGEIPGSSPFAGQSHLGATGFSSMLGASASSFYNDSASMASGDTARMMSQTWPPAFGASMTRSLSATDSFKEKEKYMSLDAVGHRAPPGIPFYLSPTAAPPGGPPRSAPFVKLNLDKALSPQSPGKGGWPLAAHHLTCPEWGGAGKPKRPPTKQQLLQQQYEESLLLPPATPPSRPSTMQATLSRAAVSAPSLARWRANLASAG